jgi:hypothetical protein
MITVRCYDGKVYSEEDHVFVAVINPTICENPEISQEDTFQLHFCDLEFSLQPNVRYELYGMHQKIFEINGITLLTVLEAEIPDEYHWLKVEFGENQIITPSDGIVHYTSVYLTITEEATQNVRIKCTISGVYGPKEWMETFPWFVELRRSRNFIVQDDIQILIGNWN